MSTAEEKANVSAVMKEGLLEGSAASIRMTSYLLRDKFDRSDPDEMFTYVHATRMLIQHALNLAEKNAPQAAEIKQAIVPVTYNLAADTWPGWGDQEPPDPAYLQIGMEAARLNLGLREVLDQPPQGRYRGHWIVGIHQIAAGDHTGALESFAICSALAEEAGDDQSGVMAQGWTHVTNILSGKEESKQLADIRHALSAMGKEGAFLASQFEPALAAFR